MGRSSALLALLATTNSLLRPPQQRRAPLAPRHAILTVGKPYAWDDALDRLAYVREHGIDQFIEMWKRSQATERNDDLIWGDELEYAILRLDEARARVVLRGPALRDELAAKEQQHSYRTEGCAWHPEYGAWMIEGTPLRPYSGYAADLVRVERNMRLRRRRLLSLLGEDEICPTLVTFPGFGVGDFAVRGDGTRPDDVLGPVANSASVPDGVIHPHPRFAALTANIRARRGENVECGPPRFRDVHTDAGAPPHIEGMDAMAYGMGACCLQVTFQARDSTEARYCYDQLAALAPVMLALTAASPAWRGALADCDARWDVIAASVDDRRAAEDGRGASAADGRLAGAGTRRLPRSRYSSISRYAFECDGPDGQVRRFCDVDAPVDGAALEKLLAAGVDDALARHVAHLFVRDPLVLFEGLVEEVDDATRTDHFDNLQSTNWNTVRLKPPVGLGTPDGSEFPEPGWRAEFRPMEIQLTDFENAAFAVFSVLVTRVILAFDLSLYVPLSRVDANMRRAQRRDAATAGKFYFRRQLAPDDPGSKSFNNCCGGADDDVFEEMTCAEIIDGKGDYFPGLAPLAYAYLDHIGCDGGTLARVSEYIELVRKKASGEAKTGARWIRDFITGHPDYKRDSVVSDAIARDLAVAAHEVGIGARQAPELTGGVAVREVNADGAWDIRLKPDKIPTADERRELLARYARRTAFQELKIAGVVEKQEAEASR